MNNIEFIVDPEILTRWLRKFSSKELVVDLSPTVSFKILADGILGNHQNDAGSWRVFSKLGSTSACFESYPEVESSQEFSLLSVEDLTKLLKRFKGKTKMILEQEDYPLLRFIGSARTVTFPLTSAPPNTLGTIPQMDLLAKGDVELERLKAFASDAEYVTTGQLVFTNTDGQLTIAGGCSKGRSFKETLDIQAEGLDSPIGIDLLNYKEVLKFADAPVLNLQVKYYQPKDFKLVAFLENKEGEYTVVNILSGETTTL